MNSHLRLSVRFTSTPQRKNWQEDASLPDLLKAGAHAQMSLSLCPTWDVVQWYGWEVTSLICQ